MELFPGQENLIKGQKFKKVRKVQLWFLYTSLPLNILYQYKKFEQNPWSSFGVLALTRKFNKGE